MELLLNFMSRLGGWKYPAGQFTVFYWKLSSGVLEVRKFEDVKTWLGYYG